MTIFVDPKMHKSGVGRLLIKHALKISGEIGVKDLMVFVDPFAEGFYKKLGAKFLFNSKSSIPGRLIPVYELNISSGS